VKGLISFANFPSPFQQLSGFLTNDSQDFGAYGYFNVPDNPNWFDFQIDFFAYTSSNTCNPYGLVLVSLGGTYPYTGYIELLAYTKTGSPTWTQDTYGYSAGSTPQYLDAVVAAIPAGLWQPVFVFNDNSVQIDARISFSWHSVGPSNVTWQSSDAG
jgi:hypothetical protein